MRAIRYSQTFFEELAELLEQGVGRFGIRVVAEKRNLVLTTIKNAIAQFPVRPVDPVLGVCCYHVRKTPFVVFYDFDATELRVHLVIHASADRTQVDLMKVVW